MTDLKIVQTGPSIRVEIDGVDISEAIRNLSLEMDGRTRSARVSLDLAIDTVEIESLAERDVTIMVNVPKKAEEALQALGWVKTSDKTSYLAPREDQPHRRLREVPFHD